MTDRELMQQALEGIDWLRHHLTQHHGCLHMDPTASGISAWLNRTESALRERLAQANEFNPDWDALAVMVEEQQRMAKRIEELEAQQKPWVKTYAGGKPNYTVPEEQTRQWQGLTDEEIAEVRHLYDGTAGWTIERFARQIEAKLKEKNT